MDQTRRNTTCRSVAQRAGQMLGTGLLLIAAANLGCKAQVSEPSDPNPPRGTSPTGVYDIGSLDTVNPVYKTVQLTIPIVKLPTQRGGTPGVELNLTYNSALYDVKPIYYPGAPTQNADDGGPLMTLWPSASGGWTYPVSYSLDIEQRIVTGTTSCTDALYSNLLTLISPDGSRHLLRLSGQTDNAGDGYYEYDINGHSSASGCPTAPDLTTDLTYYTTDGTYLTVVVPHSTSCSPSASNYEACLDAMSWWIYFSDGSMSYVGTSTGAYPYQHWSRSYDGYSVSGSYVAGGIGQPRHFAGDIYDYAASRHIQIIYNGLSDSIYYPGANNSTLTTTVNWATTTPQARSYNCGNSNPAHFCTLSYILLVVSSIQIPTAFCDTAQGSVCPLSYAFSYNSDNSTGLGELRSMGTPSGSSLTYQYTYDSAYENYWYQYLYDYLTYRILNVGTNYTSTTETTHYDFGGGGATVTSPDGGITTYLYTSYLVTSGSIPGGGGRVTKITYPDLTTVDRQWGALWSYNSGDGQPSHKITENWTVLGEYRTITALDPGTGQMRAQTSAVGYAFDQNGNLTTQYDYDLGAGSKPSCLPDGCGNVFVGFSSALIRTTSRTFKSPPVGPIPALCQSDQNSYRCAQRLYRAAVATEQVTGANGGSRFTEYTYTDENNFPYQVQLSEERRWNSSIQSNPMPSAANCYPNCLSTATASVTTYGYDRRGNVITITEPGLSNDSSGVRPVTAYVYQDVAINGITYGALVLVGMTRAQGTPAQQFTGYTRDLNSMLPLTIIEYGNGVTTKITYDNVGRQTLVQEAYNDPNGKERDTSIQYSVQRRCRTTQSDFASVGGTKQTVAAAEFYDGLGRLWRKRDIEDGSAPSCDTSQTGGILTDTQYMLQGGISRYTLQSNPYRTTETDDTAVGWTLTNFDQLQRPTDVLLFSGTATPTPSTTGWVSKKHIDYNQLATGLSGVGDKTTEEAGTATQSIQNVTQTLKDAVGRTTTVFENPATGVTYQTAYTYDASDQLYSVYQNGQTRSFVYDSLGRLTCSYHPEMTAPGATPVSPDRTCTTAGQLNAQGLAYSYAYDANGNTTTRSDARGATVTYTYDVLNRLQFKAYGGTPAGTGSSYAFQNASAVTYCYDGYQVSGPGQCTFPPSPAAYSHGRLTHVSSSVASTQYTGFDPFGNVTGMQQSVGPYGPYSLSYAYNLAGKLTSMTYPSGRTVSTTYDGAGNAYGSTGTLGSNTATYALSATYYAHGGIKILTLGNNILAESRAFNAQLLPTNISAASASASIGLVFTYFANGNVNTQAINTGGTTSYSETYGYEGVSRLTSASEPLIGNSQQNAWSQTYCYDAVGNRVVMTGAASGNQTPTGTCTPSSMPYTNNHWSGAPTDVAGNVISDGLSMFTYDSENRVMQSTGRGTVQYAYDGDGRRVQKSGPNGTTVYVYDADGNMAAEYASQTQSTCSPSPCYVTQDGLGSTRMVTNATGQVARRRDFFPFGEEIPQGTNGRPAPDYQTGLQQTLPDSLNWKFTGNERDPETTLDFVEARYFSGAQGRFTSADQPLNDQDEADPQSWNLYSYVRNNPLRFIDPSGTCSYDPANGYSDTDGGNLRFKGPCANGTIGDSNNNRNSVTVGVGRELAVLLMLQGVGQTLSSPHQWADLISNAGQAAASVLAPGPTAIAQCATTGNCDRTGMALAMIPGVPRVPRTAVSRFVKNRKLRNILAAFNRTGTGIGTGSTADAIRSELQTGTAVRGKFHYTKGVELRDGLLTLLRNPNLDPSDRAVVKELLIDLQEALSRK